MNLLRRPRLVDLTLDAELDGIRRGDLATLALTTTRDEGGYWLPLTGLTESSRGLWACLVAEHLDPAGAGEPASHRLARRELEVLHFAGDRVYVTTAVAAKGSEPLRVGQTGSGEEVDDGRWTMKRHGDHGG